MPLPAWPARDAAHLLVRGAQMAALEETLFASGLPVEALMEKAALAVAQRLLPRLRRQGSQAEPGVLVLVGPGHNGGDGLVVARELALAGVPVRIWAPFERLKPLTAAHLRHARWLGIPCLENPPDPADPALWLDGLFGVGQRRSPGEGLEQLLAQRQAQRPAGLVAIDVPTGLCSDSGRPLGQVAACAAQTWTLGLAKRGLLQDEALAWVGSLERIDLGLPMGLLQELPADTPLALGPDDRASAPWPPLPAAAGKYQRGRLLQIAGSDRYRGAARLALAGAAAAGCGSLRAVLPPSLAETLWQLQPDVVLEEPLAATAAGGLALAELPASALERLDALLVGPGLGPATAAESRAEAASWERLQAFAGLLLLDADGLNRLAGGEHGEATAWLQGRAGPTWITPHAGEFARLFPDLAALEPADATAAAARATGAAVLRKGAHSLIAAPDGRCWQLAAACPQVARAGLGDVLAGYAAARGAQAVAAAGSATGGDAALLAAAALEHAAAGLDCHGDPLAVAEVLKVEIHTHALGKTGRNRHNLGSTNRLINLAQH
jgi:NAD(P)H-hydrate epimerase